MMIVLIQQENIIMVTHKRMPDQVRHDVVCPVWRMGEPKGQTFCVSKKWTDPKKSDKKFNFLGLLKMSGWCCKY